MIKQSLKITALFVLVAMTLVGCSSTTVCKNFSGLSTTNGDPVAHLNTTNIALHLLMKKPLKGDATLEKTVEDFTAAAKGEGASKVRIVQSSQNKLWWVLFPFTIVITPVISNVAGDAVK